MHLGVANTHADAENGNSCSQLDKVYMLVEKKDISKLCVDYLSERYERDKARVATLVCNRLRHDTDRTDDWGTYIDNMIE